MRRGDKEIRIVKGRTVRVRKDVWRPSLRNRAEGDRSVRAVQVSWHVELLGFDNWFLFFEYFSNAVEDYTEADRFDELFEEAASLLVELPETQKEQS